MPTPLEDFLKNFGETELPALYSTVRAISSISEDSDLHADALADLIRSDASMTSHILKHTQGAYRIPLKGKHNTVNRAIVMLGFKEVKSLCLTVSILEGLSSEKASEAYLGELAKIFHGALQARSIALLKGERSCEEVFTTAILSRVGNLIFWASGDSRVDILYAAYRKSKPSQYQNVERATLGFTLSELSSAVMSSWGLQDYFKKQDFMTDSEDIRFDASELGMELADHAALGWEGQGMSQVIDRVSIYLDLPKDLVRGTLRENTAIAAQFAEGYKVKGLAEEINKTLKPNLEDRLLDSPVEEELDGEANFDPAFQLKVLSEIGASLQEGFDINKIIGKTLEGVYKGVGFDRVLFALLTPNRKQLRGKAGQGVNYRKALDSFKIDLDEGKQSVFSITMKDGEAMWLTEGLEAESNIPIEFKNSLKASECILVPLVVTNRSIGMFYADKVDKSKKITAENFAALKQFVFQIQLALEHMQRGDKMCYSKADNGVPLKI